jgi:hypothetical protein
VSEDLLTADLVDVAKPADDDLRMWSVTTIIGCLDKPALMYWAAGLTADAAIAQADYLAARIEHEGREKVWKDLRDARFSRPKGQRSATELGTAVHDACEKYALTGVKPEVDAEVQPFLDQFDAWVQKWQPVYEAAEMTVYSPTYGYAGTLDAIMVLDGMRVIADYKGLDVNTPIPTPAGWTTMGALEVGDEVFGADGQPCRVMGRGPLRERPCYRVTFDDASSVVCDDEHLWPVRSSRSGRLSVLSAAQLHDLIETALARGQQRRWVVDNAAPLNLPDRELPMDPYVLGLWLGDGTRRTPQITFSEQKAPVIDALDATGYDLRYRPNWTRYIPTIRPQLRALGLLEGDKFLPDEYLRGSYEQRLALLQGLMDSDGSWNATRRQAVFSTTDKSFSLAVQELVVSLGWRVSAHTHPARGFGLEVPFHQVYFTPFGANPFRHVPHKRDAVRVAGSAKCRRRLIRSVDPVPTVPTSCIVVDSSDNTYLCGHQMVPTHNSSRQSFDNYGKPRGPYPEVALQLAAYRYAELAATWRARRYEYRKRRYYLLGDSEQTESGPVPKVDGGIAIHISPEHCTAYPVKCGEDVHTAFLYIIEAARWSFEMSKSVIGDPLVHPSEALV